MGNAGPYGMTNKMGDAGPYGMTNKEGVTKHAG
jgi:hypothetical protein